MDFRNVCFSYDSDECLFSDVSWVLPEKGLVCLLGRSGSGKSTLLSLLAGFLAPTAGSILRKDGERTITIFQESNLIDGLSVKENAELYLSVHGVEKEEREKISVPVLQRLGLTDISERLCSDLSGGERQRVALALAACSDCIVLADEPTGALDEKNAEAAMFFLKELGRSRLIVCATHNVSLARRFADSIYEIKGCRLDRVKEGVVSTGDSPVSPIVRGRIRLRDSLCLNSGLFRRKWGRVFLASFATGFSFASLSLALSVSFGTESFVRSMSEGYYAPEVYRLSVKSEVSQKSGMTLSMKRALDQELCTSLEKDAGAVCHPSLAFFLPSSEEIGMDDSWIDFNLSPSFQEGTVSYGRPASKADECVVNGSFVEAAGLDNEEVVGKTFAIETAKEIGIRMLDKTEYSVFKMNFDFEIVGVCDERLEFNFPTAYYDYFSLYDKIGETVLGTEWKVLVSDLLEKPDRCETDVSGYETWVRSESYDKLSDWLNLHPEVESVSQSETAREAARQISVAVSQISLIFLSAMAVISFFIEFYSIGTILAESKPQYAFLYSVCSDRKTFIRTSKDCADIFLGISLAVFSVSAALLAIVLPSALASIGLPAGLAQLSLAAILIMVAAMGLISLAAIYIPLLRFSERIVLQALRSER